MIMLNAAGGDPRSLSGSREDTNCPVETRNGLSTGAAMDVLLKGPLWSSQRSLERGAATPSKEIGTQLRTRCAIISPDHSLRSEMVDALSESPFQVQRQFADFSDVQAILRFIRPMPSIVLVDSKDQSKALQIAELIENDGLPAEIVALGADRSQESALQLMRAGIREYVRLPIENAELVDSLERAKSHLSKKSTFVPSGDVFSFLPAKPGSGASTIVANTSLALSRVQAGTLAADLDIHSGVLGFLLRIENSQSIFQAIENLSSIDDALWEKLTGRREDLTVLPSDVRVGGSLSEVDVRDLIAIMRRLHKTSFLDLPDVLQPHVLAAIEESQRTFIVCTPDMVSLHLARKKVQELQSLGFKRLSLIINRYDGKSPLGAKHIEEVVEAGVEFVFSSDYRALIGAISAGTDISTATRLGREFREFANKLTTSEIGTKPRPAQRRFVDYFWIPQGPMWNVLSSRRS